MDSPWFPPVDRPLRPGGPYVFAANAIGMTTLLLPESRWRQAIAVPPVLWLVYSLRQHTTGRPDEDYLTAVNVCMAGARFVDFAVLRTPETAFRRIGPDGRVETAGEIARMTPWQKFKWNVDLFSTMRGIGWNCDWNWKVKNIYEVPRGVSRRRFVLEQVLRAAYCFAFIDLHEWYLVRTPWGDGTRPVPDLLSLPLGEQVFLAWFRACHSGFTMAFGMYLLAAVFVGAGVSRPQYWPPIFGSFFADGYTLRNIWGRCWHQFLRRTFETCNTLLIGLLRIKRGTLTSRYLQLYNAFFVSAVIHHLGALNTPYTPLVWYQFVFFMTQPVAITIEDAAVYVGKKAGLRKTWKTKAVGYAWVACALSVTLRYGIKAFMEAGLGAVRHPLVEKCSIMERLFP